MEIFIYSYSSEIFMEQALIVDIQSIDARRFPNEDRKYYLEKWKEKGTPVLFGLTPYQRGEWQEFEEDFAEIGSRKGSGILLEGRLHVCAQRNHKIRDPHHQDICTSWFQSSSPYSEIVEKIGEGIEFVHKSIGVKPIGYIPPQHLWNDDIVKAVRKNGLKYLVTNAMFTGMEPYKENGVIIVPSGSIKKGRIDNPVVHVYYDMIKANEILLTQKVTNKSKK